MHDTCDESRPQDGRNLQQVHLRKLTTTIGVSAGMFLGPQLAVTVEGPVYFAYASFLTSQREGWSLWFYLHSSCKLPDLPTRWLALVALFARCMCMFSAVL